MDEELETLRRTARDGPSQGRLAVKLARAGRWDEAGHAALVAHEAGTPGDAVDALAPEDLDAFALREVANLPGVCGTAMSSPALAARPSGREALVALEDELVAVSVDGSMKRLARVPGETYLLATDVEGKCVALARLRERVAIVDLASGKLLPVLRPFGSVNAIALARGLLVVQHDGLRATALTAHDRELSFELAGRLVALDARGSVAFFLGGLFHVFRPGEWEPAWYAHTDSLPQRSSLWRILAARARIACLGVGREAVVLHGPGGERKACALPDEKLIGERGVVPALSPSGRHLALGYSGLAGEGPTRLDLLDIHSGRFRSFEGVDVGALAWAPSGRRLFVLGRRTLSSIEAP